jgi:hypothetical protein
MRAAKAAGEHPTGIGAIRLLLLSLIANENSLSESKFCGSHRSWLPF